MSDQQQTSAQYPGFQVSAEGLRDLHAALGRELHQGIERDRREAQMLDLIGRLKAQYEPAPEPAAAETEPTPLKAKKGVG